jgi:hypothetical protein
MTAIVYYISRSDGAVEIDKNIFKSYDLKSINEVISNLKKVGAAEIQWSKMGSQR